MTQGSGARSSSAALYRRWYKSTRWLKRRAAQLRAEPLCAFCQARGIVAPATVADHLEPHRGNETRFFEGKLQSLCNSCHSRDKQAAERTGFSTEVGVDGWPVDPRHRANRQ